MQIINVDGTNAIGRSAQGEEAIDLALVGEQPIGTWVLGFLGAAREVINAEEAEKIAKALEALRSIQAGGDIGDAFDDIIEKGPQLPPHLEAARAAGKTTA